MLIVTSETIEGKKIAKTLGMIEARCNVFVLNERKSAEKNLIKKAEELGANAITGYRYDSRHAYGTAIVVE